MSTNTLHKSCKFDMIRFRDYDVIAEKMRVVIYPKFYVHHVGKTMRSIEKWLRSFRIAPTSSMTLQILREIEQQKQQAPAVNYRHIKNKIANI